MRVHRDVRYKRAAEKPEPPLRGHESNTANAMATGKDGEYQWFASLHHGCGMAGSGEIAKRRGWFCPDCGAPCELGDGDDVPSCCARCGSCEPAEFRDGE